MKLKFWEREEDDKFAERLNDGITALNDRTTLVRFFGIMLSINALLWAAVIIFPEFSGHVFEKLNDGRSNRVAAIVWGIPFGLGFFIVYSLFRLKFPDIEDPKIESAVMSGFFQSEASTRRWRVWLASTVGGVLNVLLLLLADIYLVRGF